MKKISAVYKIVNTVTGEFYIGSSKNVMKRWQSHKRPSAWKKQPNSRLYQDFQKYGLDKFDFQILISIMPECLKQVEQDCIELMKPAYNNINAKGLDVERQRETHRKADRRYRQSDKGKEHLRKYRQSDKGKEVHRKAVKKYRQSSEGKESHHKAVKKYRNQICFYNGETLTLCALIHRFSRAGIEHPTLEAKKYLL